MFTPDNYIPYGSIGNYVAALRAAAIQPESWFRWPDESITCQQFVAVGLNQPPPGQCFAVNNARRPAHPVAADPNLICKYTMERAPFAYPASFGKAWDLLWIRYGWMEN